MTSPHPIARCLADLAGEAPIWLDPALAPELPAEELPPRTADPDKASLVALRAAEVGDDGRFRGDVPPRAGHVVAVCLLDGSDRIVPRAAGQARAQHVLCELGLMRVTEEGLVILKLARGVSARDLQARVQPTLMISPNLQEIGKDDAKK